MGQIALGMATSHAFTVMDPSEWDAFRLRNQQAYSRRYGRLPVDTAPVAAETPADISTRFGVIQRGLASLRATLERVRPDALLVVADDQNENFTTTIPQIAIYTGERFIDGRPEGAHSQRQGHPALAEAILDTCMKADIDMTCIREFPDDRLFAHAFGPVLQVLDPTSRIPVVPIFVNAIHEPSPSPRRCYYLGEMIRRAVENYAGIGRVAILGSGGLSHFTAGYPWKHYKGTLQHGEIDEHFDRAVFEKLSRGLGSDLAQFSGEDLLSHGEIELRSWIVTLGAIGDVKPQLLEYDTFYRALMGMGVACWNLVEAA
jgi:aromatic ring-opening dioxygenase catalytic subunit (LigB family)